MRYNNENFSRYKQDIKSSQPIKKKWEEYTRDELIIKFMPLVENIARKFKSSEAAAGVMGLSDRIQFGHFGLVKAVDKIIWKKILESSDPEKTLKSFLAKRIRGAIRRAVDSTRTGMRIPEHKLNEIRRDFEDEEKSQIFFNSMFESIDIIDDRYENYAYQIPDESEDPMRKEKLYKAITSVMLKHLTDKEYNVIRLSYGLGCDKLSAKEIADKLDMKGTSSYVRVSQLKRQAINKLKEHLTSSQVSDYL